MQQKNIEELRHHSRKMVRELGLLQIDKDDERANPKNWHALIEIENNPKITISKLANKLVLHISIVSRLVDGLVADGFVDENFGVDKREKFLKITKKGLQEIKKIDEFSNSKIANAFRFLGKKDQEEILFAIKKYAAALEKSRLQNEMKEIKIRTISTSRNLREQIKKMVENIQENEFAIDINESVNACIIKAEEDFYYNNSYNFFYATNIEGKIIGCIGLKRLDKKNGEVKKFFVTKEYRGQNVGKALMARLLKAAKKHKMQYLCLGSVEKLVVAQKFYLKIGFQKMSPKNLPKTFMQNDVDDVFFMAKLSDTNI